MRILIAHEALAGGGGVETYLSRVIPALATRGHDVAVLHHNPRAEAGPTSLAVGPVPTFGVADEGLDGAFARASQWRPDVCFSHNMRHLDVEARLVAAHPTVKMMHGYFGTCVSGQKAHAFPRVVGCSRTLGPACLALYLPRQCGRRRPGVMLSGYVWALRQRRLFDRYAQIVVASGHMRDEYSRHGVPDERLTVAPLFPTTDWPAAPRPLPDAPAVLFAGRMTPLKGGDVLVRAIAAANGRLSRPLELLCAGDGPEREAWRALATNLGVRATFPGWVTGGDLADLIRRASVVAVPSLWPEPFGLTGLDAAVHGVPAVAFDSGGIGEWLRDGVNGRLVAVSVEALADALAALAGDPALLARLGESARRVAMEFDLGSHVGRLESVFAQAIA